MLPIYRFFDEGTLKIPDQKTFLFDKISIGGLDMKLLLLVFFFFIKDFGCDWRVEMVKDGLFAAFNYRTDAYQIFGMPDLPSNAYGKIYEGATFDIYLDENGQIAGMTFCESEIA